MYIYIHVYIYVYIYMYIFHIESLFIFHIRLDSRCSKVRSTVTFFHTLSSERTSENFYEILPPPAEKETATTSAVRALLIASQKSDLLSFYRELISELAP